VNDVLTDPDVTEEERAAFAAIAVRAHVTVCLVKGGRLVGVFGVRQAEPRTWKADEVALVEETAERTWAALERQRAEEALAQHVRDLARAHADLREVAYVSAHELQEPVRQMGLYTQYLAARYRDASEADIQEAVAFIVEGAKRMQAQFTDLTHYLEVDEHAQTVAPTNCEDLVQRVLTDLHVAITTSAAVITTDPLPTLDANAAHLRLVLHELLDNALKFCGSAPPRVHVWAAREDHGWRFAVRDHGIGIAPSAKDQLFRFFRKFQRRSDYPGTGMGLAICKKIVERHGGRIWIESQPGEGTTVLFTIPDRRQTAGKKTRDEESSKN
jgi:light-regulated signal transduction histidine kinase (bacteriophytochrome)